MDINTESKNARSGNVPGSGKALHPTISNSSKASEAARSNHNQSIMATIADDDDRLLVRIGYTPVRSLTCQLKEKKLGQQSHRSSNDISQDGPLSHMPSPFLVSWVQYPLRLGLQLALAVQQQQFGHGLLGASWHIA